MGREAVEMEAGICIHRYFGDRLTGLSDRLDVRGEKEKPNMPDFWFGQAGE